MLYGSTFTSTLETGTHKMYGSEGYMKELLGPEGCRMLSEFHCHTFVTLNASNHLLSYLQVTNLPVSPTWYFLSWSDIYNVECICLNLVSWGRSDTLYYLGTWKCSSSPLLRIIVFCCAPQQYSTERWLREALQHLTHEVILMSWSAPCKDFAVLPFFLGL